MRSNFRFFLPLALVFALPACGAEPFGMAGQSAAGELETEDQRVLYALGQILGQNVANANLTEEEVPYLQMGLSDSVLGRDSQVDMEQVGPLVQGFMQGRIQLAAAAELDEATEFVAQQAALPGAELLPSGLVIQEMTPGTGATPTAADVVTVHYHGTLRDGTVFDSSVDRGEPATFPLGQVIPCWTEGLQHIQLGGKSKLVCPPDLAYGPTGPPGIPGNAALMFEVELLEIGQEE